MTSRGASAVSIGLHLAIAAGVLTMPDPRKRPAPRTVPVTVSTAKQPPPAPPPPEPEPEPVRVPPVLRPKLAAPRTAPTRRRIEMPPPRLPPAVAPSPPRPDTADSPPVFGVTMESVTEGASSVAADVGNTLAADPSTARRTAAPPPPVVVAPAPPPDIVPPKVLRPIQAPYPRAAREAGVSGKVLLLIQVDDQGRVTKARVLRGPGHGLNEAALEAVRQFTFSPGTTNGRKGPMEIRYTYTFVLDD